MILDEQRKWAWVYEVADGWWSVGALCETKASAKQYAKAAMLPSRVVRVVVTVTELGEPTEGAAKDASASERQRARS